MPTTVSNFWNTTTVNPNGLWPASVPDYVETLIVGAGGAGLSTAIAMALRGYKELLVVDAMLPGWRGARKGIGAATLMGCTPHYLYSKGVTSPESFRALALCKVGIKNVNEYIQRFWPDQDWCRRSNFGGFHFAKDIEEEKVLEDTNKFYQVAQVNSSLMQGNAISKLTDMNIGHAGIFIPNECMVNPAKFFNGIITGIRKLGIDIISGYIIDTLYQEGLNWVVSDIMGNTIRCKNLILATGSNFAALPINDQLEDFIFRKRVTYFATPPILNHRLNPYVISTLDGSEIYRRYENRIIGCIDTMDGVPVDLKGPDKSAFEKALHRVSVLYPLTESEKTFDFVWTKNVIQTKDTLPIVGQVNELKNLFLNIGYNHHSLGWQMVGGAVIAELILGK